MVRHAGVLVLVLDGVDKRNREIPIERHRNNRVQKLRTPDPQS
jgi:hypothetical protein